MNLNAILSGISAWPVKPAGGGAPGIKPSEAAQDRGPSAGGDIFEQGQWWKNRAMARVDAVSAGACSCGSCTSCGVRAYGAFARGGPGPVAGAAVAGQTVAAVGGLPPANAGEAVRENSSAPAAEESNRVAPGYFPYPFAGEAGAAGRNEGGPLNPLAPAAGGERAQAVEPAVEPTVQREAGQALVQELSREEKLEVARLQQLDSQVKAHEMAHLAVAGPYARGGASFTYTTGPDGKKYAVGGEVSIDTSREPSPEATIRKMRIIRAAALAPADPSPQDRKVAAQADAAMTEARRELEMIRLEQQREAARHELDMRFIGAGEGGLDPAADNEPEAATYTPPFGPASPVAARRAAAALAAFDQAAPQLQVRA
ncbi:putative metalloprotease CJM1_0395 family protein [Desulfurivibrio alkaliphilus]|nr:putative metalloprotease CJM1_0395 family protein [Desulfurivibrio alkaliphilus]